MHGLHRQSIRSTIRAITLVAALTSLLLAMVTPFVGTADAAHANPYAAGNGVLDAGVGAPITDVCAGADDTHPVGGDVKVDEIHDAAPPVIKLEQSGPGKSDFCQVWLDSAVDAHGDVWLYFAFQLDAESGSQTLYLELLQDAADCDIFSYATCNPFENRDAGSQILGFDYNGNATVIDAQLRDWNVAAQAFDPFQPVGGNVDGMAGPAGSGFGEIAVNLSQPPANPIIPNVNVDAPCEIIAAGLPYTITGNSDPNDGGGGQGNTDSASMIDIVIGQAAPITNCGSITVTKQVVGDDDFGATFPITLADGDAIDRTENLGDDGSFTQTDVYAGTTFTVSEDLSGLPGWTIDSIACSDGSSSGEDVTSLSGITVTAGATTTCTVTNSPTRPTITLVKTVVNDDGGSAVADDFQGYLDGGEVAWGVASTVDPVQHTASESTLPGYTPGDWGGDCAADGTIDLDLGDVATCTITNDDQPASLTLTKVVENTNGGTATEDDFAPTVGYDGTGDASDVTTDPDWDTYTVPAGTYTVGETDATGSSLLADGDYVLTSIECDGVETDSITLGNGDSGECVVTNTDVPAGLTVVKQVQNDWGGTLAAGDFPLTVNGDTVDSGIAESFPAGDYTIAEQQQPGYELVSASCTRDGEDVPGISGESFDISVGINEEVVCIFVNRDVPATVTLVKSVTNDDGGDLEADDFPVTLDGDTAAWGVTYDVAAGGHTVGETQQAGYTTTGWGGDCTAGQDPTTGSFTAVLATDYTCTITNDDQPATVVLRKTVVNDDGGTLDQDDFPASVDDEPVDWDEVVAIDAGDHTVAEDSQPGYAAGSWGGDCDPDGSLDAQLGGTYECTITNDDIAPTITLRKTVVNDDGGDLDEDDFQAYVDGDEVDWDATVDIEAGDHTASEDTRSGYDASDWGGDCAGDGTFTAELDTDYVCTITNDDEPGELVLTKVVDNDHGGDATQDDFVPTLDGDDADWGANEVDAGTYTVDERDADGSDLLADGEYVQVSIECDGESTDTVTVRNGERRECVVTNRDVPAGLTVVKQVRNNWGGTLTPADFPLTVDGDEVDSGASSNYPAGDYTIAEQQQPGYELVDVTCVSDREGELDVDGESVDVSVDNNESVVCTFVNRDVPASLTVLKDVVNDDGGTATQDDFTPVVNDDESSWGSQDTTEDGQTGVPAGSYTIGELVADGYALSDITCTDETELGDDADSVTVELDLADEVTCTVVNDDIAPTVVLRKTVVNDDGGTLTQGDFPVTFDGDAADWDDTITTTAGDHVAAEQTQAGYLAGDWGGDCAADGSLSTEVGGTYECTITNDDVPAGLTVVKEVVNDDGGTAEVGDFPLTVTPEGGDTVTVTSGAQSFVAAGTYTISEEQQPGYELRAISCDTGTATTAQELTVTVGLDERVVCTLVNDDLPIGIEVIKTPDVDEVDYTVGSDDEVVITYTYVVTNTGATTLTDLSMVDDVLGSIDLGVDEMAPGQVVVVTAEHVVTQADADAGQVVNVVVVEGTSPDGRTTDDDDDAEVLVNEIEVLPNVIEKPAPLPRTGFDTTTMALLSALVAGLGAVLLLATDAPSTATARRRRRDR